MFTVELYASIRRAVMVEGLRIKRHGHILFGSASTVCPDGQRGVTFWLYIGYYGKGGWYSEVPEVKRR